MLFNIVAIATATFRFLEGKFQMAYNVSVLGKDFIDGCPVLSREESGLVKFYADSDQCDYAVFEGRWRAFRSCVEDADVMMDAVLQLIESDAFADARLCILIQDQKLSHLVNIYSAAYKKAQCDYAESLFFTCRKDTVDRCYSDAKIDESAAKTKGALQERCVRHKLLISFKNFQLQRFFSGSLC